MPPANFKKEKYILEVCIDSVASALSAEAGGAQRVELCSGLSEGGLTPSAGLIEACRKRIGLAIHVLIRPRRGDFLYSSEEFEIMKKDIEVARELGADGVVLGILNKDGSIDTQRTGELIETASPMKVTFHRAFDLASDPFQALEDLMRLNVQRLLTSGQQATAYQGAELIRELVERAGKGLVVMPGGGINPQNIREVMEKTGASEFHSTARRNIKSGMQFFRKELSMGGNGSLSEYEQLLADPAQIKAIIAAFKQ